MAIEIEEIPEDLHTKSDTDIERLASELWESVPALNSSELERGKSKAEKTELPSLAIDSDSPSKNGVADINKVEEGSEILPQPVDRRPEILRQLKELIPPSSGMTDAQLLELADKAIEIHGWEKFQQFLAGCLVYQNSNDDIKRCLASNAAIEPRPTEQSPLDAFANQPLRALNFQDMLQQFSNGELPAQNAFVMDSQQRLRTLGNSLIFQSAYIDAVRQHRESEYRRSIGSFGRPSRAVAPANITLEDQAASDRRQNQENLTSAQNNRLFLDALPALSQRNQSQLETVLATQLVGTHANLSLEDKSRADFLAIVAVGQLRNGQMPPYLHRASESGARNNQFELAAPYVTPRADNIAGPIDGHRAARDAVDAINSLEPNPLMPNPVLRTSPAESITALNAICNGGRVPGRDVLAAWSRGTQMNNALNLLTRDADRLLRRVNDICDLANNINQRDLPYFSPAEREVVAPQRERMRELVDSRYNSDLRRDVSTAKANLQDLLRSLRNKWEPETASSRRSSDSPAGPIVTNPEGREHLSRVERSMALMDKICTEGTPENRMFKDLLERMDSTPLSEAANLTGPLLRFAAEFVAATLIAAALPGVGAYIAGSRVGRLAAALLATTPVRNGLSREITCLASMATGMRTEPDAPLMRLLSGRSSLPEFLANTAENAVWDTAGNNLFAPYFRNRLVVPNNAGQVARTGSFFAHNLATDRAVESARTFANLPLGSNQNNPTPQARPTDFGLVTRQLPARR